MRGVLSGAPGADAGSADPAVKFVLQCLLLLPWHLCVAVSNQVTDVPLLSKGVFFLCFHLFSTKDNIVSDVVYSAARIVLLMMWMCSAARIM